MNNTVHIDLRSCCFDTRALRAVLLFAFESAMFGSVCAQWNSVIHLETDVGWMHNINRSLALDWMEDVALEAWNSQPVSSSFAQWEGHFEAVRLHERGALRLVGLGHLQQFDRHPEFRQAQAQLQVEWLEQLTQHVSVRIDGKGGMQEQWVPNWMANDAFQLLKFSNPSAMMTMRFQNSDRSKAHIYTAYGGRLFQDSWGGQSMDHRVFDVQAGWNWSCFKRKRGKYRLPLVNPSRSVAAGEIAALVAYKQINFMDWENDALLNPLRHDEGVDWFLTATEDGAIPLRLWTVLSASVAYHLPNRMGWDSSTGLRFNHRQDQSLGDFQRKEWLAFFAFKRHEKDWHTDVRAQMALSLYPDRHILLLDHSVDRLRYSDVRWMARLARPIHRGWWWKLEGAGQWRDSNAGLGQPFWNSFSSWSIQFGLIWKTPVRGGRWSS